MSRRNDKNRKETISLAELSEAISPPSYCVEEDREGNLVYKSHGVKYPDRPDSGRYSKVAELEKLKKPVKAAISPPTYRVEEDEDGFLVNKELKVVYPEFPKKGRYSLKNYLKKLRRAKVRKDSDEHFSLNYKSEPSVVPEPRRSRSQIRKHKEMHHRYCRCTCGECCCSSSRSLSRRRREEKRDFSVADWDTASQVSLGDRSIIMAKRNTMPIPDCLKNAFVGAKSASDIEIMLQPTQFLVYYRRPDKIDSIDDVPLGEPLMIAYKSHDEQVSHFPLIYRNAGDNVRMWRVDLGRNAKEQPGFYSLHKLVQYYKTFAVTNDEAVEFFQGY